MTFADGVSGRASTPAARKAGARERARTTWLALGDADSASIEIVDFLQGRRFQSQSDFDASLSARLDYLGADVCLALSLAFARAAATSQKRTLASYIASISRTTARMPSPLVAIFSGGIHGPEMPLQQIMLIVTLPRFCDAARITMHIYDSIEADAQRRDALCGYSPSSGMLLTQSDCRYLLDILAETIARLGYQQCAGIGIDVAAEHLKVSSCRYRFGSRVLTTDTLLEEYLGLCNDYPIAYIEDPFDFSDTGAWRDLRRRVRGDIAIVGDDIFATNVDFIDSTLATGILLKMNQIGTLSGTLLAASKAAGQGMSLCVSHRSFETEDTAMCDLAVSLGARYIKIGGPRRGDRTAKYNQLLRLDEAVGGHNLDHDQGCFQQA